MLTKSNLNEVFSQKIDNRDADKILWELARRPKGMSKTEIHVEIFHGNKSAAEIRLALSRLMNARLAYFRLIRTRAKKNPTEQWYSNRH
jgi:hypothetical protein